jgi:hypothetical protein
MKPGNPALTFFGDWYNDFRAEVTAAEMAELGVPDERILILLLGSLKRPHRKDVQSIEEELSAYDHAEYVIIKTPKEGIYDMLPEGLFHHPSAHKSAKTEDEIIKLIKQRKEEEQNARKFFIPFEAAINHLRMQVAIYENRLDKRTHYDELVNVFTGYWDIFQYLNTRQADLFLHLIPILHDIRENLPVVENIMQIMLQLPVQVGLQSQMPLHSADPLMSSLGDSALGVNLTTGNKLFDEGVDEIVIKIGPVDIEEFQQFTPEGKKHIIMELLCDYLLPVHLDIITEIVLHDRDRTARFTNGENHLNSVLGVDTYL